MTLAADPLASRATPSTPDCVRRAALFLDPLLEEPPTAGTPAAVRRRAAALAAEASSVCVNCPLMIECLYRAVVSHDVAGFVAGTTERQRAAIRARLGVAVAPEDFDTLAGLSGGHRQVDHTEIVRLRPPRREPGAAGPPPRLLLVDGQTSPPPGASQPQPVERPDPTGLPDRGADGHRVGSRAGGASAGRLSPGGVMMAPTVITGRRPRWRSMR